MENEKNIENTKSIRQDPYIKGLLERLPENIRKTFTDEQLFGLKTAMGANRGRRHPVDLRGNLGFWRWSYYYIFLAGRERREMTRREIRMAITAKIIFWLTFLCLSTVLGWLVLYIIKTVSGVDLISIQGPGIWAWLKTNLLKGS